MEYEVTVKIKIDPNNNIFESDPRYNLQVIQELVHSIYYDVDDIKLIECEVKLVD